MRLVDAILRQGHLSEAAILDALVTGERPRHLDRCDICLNRAAALGRGLDAIRTAAHDAADQVFRAEHLAAQQAQILRRLEQLDEPARVIAFPATPAPSLSRHADRRVAPAWVGVAAAAGLVIGAIGGHGTARLAQAEGSVAPATPTAVAAAGTNEIGSSPLPVSNAHVFEMDLESFVPEPLDAINALTPRTTLASLNASAR